MTSPLLPFFFGEDLLRENLNLFRCGNGQFDGVVLSFEKVGEEVFLRLAVKNPEFFAVVLVPVRFEPEGECSRTPVLSRECAEMERARLIVRMTAQVDSFSLNSGGVFHSAVFRTCRNFGAFFIEDFRIPFEGNPEAGCGKKRGEQTAGK